MLVILILKEGGMKHISIFFGWGTWEVIYMYLNLDGDQKNSRFIQ